jgi:hypothetical protein
MDEIEVLWRKPSWKRAKMVEVAHYYHQSPDRTTIEQKSTALVTMVSLSELYD